MTIARGKTVRWTSVWREGAGDAASPVTEEDPADGVTTAVAATEVAIVVMIAGVSETGEIVVTIARTAITTGGAEWCGGVPEPRPLTAPGSRSRRENMVT
mmetsp:Transcript_40627/g.107656  ORF Transcript_40627/g.107656 Transcript_40627/m.107656 type:complete len:100 (-) Transcript_40627:76-375(-)